VRRDLRVRPVRRLPVKVLLLVALALYVLGLVFSPFPYGRTYFLLWKRVLFGRTHGWRPRMRQARFLLSYALSTPVFTALWYLDELLYPGYRKLEVRPVFILGQPRSGTTFLHRTLASDRENFTAARHIEWRYPFISVQKLIRCSSLARRLLQKNYWSNTPAGEVAARMHPNKLDDWEEDGIFFEERFLHHFFIFLRFPWANLLDYLDDFTRLPEKVRRDMLATHRRVIQKVIYLNGAGDLRYLSKEVTSHTKFPEILSYYPEADFIFSLRDSGGFMNSLLALIRYSTMSKTGVDPLTIEGWEAAVLRRMEKDSARLLNIIEHQVAPERRVLLSYAAITTDIAAAVGKIYTHLDLTQSESCRKHLDEVRARQLERGRGYNYEVRAFPGFGSFDQFVEGVVRDGETAAGLTPR
jgi:omega-hydroxy-beta-dihydromenaquinone-9 sulfotransferase